MSTLPNASRASKEERRRQKDLEEARKAGNAAPEVDEEGNAINPHIPQFMAKAPWYMDTGKPSLKHQKAAPYNADPSKLNDQIQRGIKVQNSTRYRKGACTNCGAMSHQATDCLERPRKKGAKWTNQDIAPDEMSGGNKGLQYDAKRDRWDGYDPALHKNVIDEYAALEEARRKMREEQLDQGSSLSQVKKVAKAGRSNKKKKGDDDFGSSDDSANEEDDAEKYADAADQAGQKMDAKTRITVRNLRIREDTAKYLMNLDTESAHYDPKTRSMREAPKAEVAPEDATFAGENFTRSSGDVSKLQTLQLFAWQASQRGSTVHVNSNPTQGERVHEEYLRKKVELKDTSKVSMLDKYGGEEHLEKVAKELLVGQSDHYVEYSRTGQIILGQERAKNKSKYDEDVYPGNHSSVWGSWYDMNSSSWGYTCCHSTLKSSYCVGKTGLVTDNDDDSSTTLTRQPGQNQLTLVEQMAENIRRKALETSQLVKGSTLDRGKKRDLSDHHEEIVELDDGAEERKSERESKRRVVKGEQVGTLRPDRLEEAKRIEKKRKQVGGEDVERDEGEVTEEQLEAYRLHRELGAEDPMHNINNDQLLPL